MLDVGLALLLAITPVQFELPSIPLVKIQKHRDNRYGMGKETAFLYLDQMPIFLPGLEETIIPVVKLQKPKVSANGQKDIPLLRRSKLQLRRLFAVMIPQVLYRAYDCWH